MKSIVTLSAIQEHVHLEFAFLLILLVVVSWGFYRVFLRKLSPHRHTNLRNQFRNLFGHLLIFAIWFGLYTFLLRKIQFNLAIERAAAYAGLVALASGMVVFIKTFRILVFEYLFLRYMSVPVPLLLINLASLILIVAILGWMSTAIFGFRLAPILTTSAIFSAVLGLALQESLQNLFAGITLHFDQPFKIDDWIEVHQGAQKWTGVVKEISWRSTVLSGVFCEVIIVPNRTMSQSQIINFSARTAPFWKGWTFRFSFDSDIEKIRKILIEAALEQEFVLKDPAPVVFVNETTESFIPVRLVVAMNDYGKQWKLGDSIISASMQKLNQAQIKLASNKIEVSREV